MTHKTNLKTVDTLLTYHFSVPDFFEGGKPKDKFVVIADDPSGLPKGTKGVILSSDINNSILVKTEDGKLSYCDKTSVIPETKFNCFKEDFENGNTKVAVNSVEGYIKVFRVA